MFELIGQLNNEVNKNWCPLLINPQYAMEWARLYDRLSTFNYLKSVQWSAVKGQKFRSSKVIEKKEPIKKQFHLIYFSNLQVIPDRNSVEGSLLYVSDLVVLEKYVCGLNIYK